MLHRFVRKELWHEIESAKTSAQSIEHQRDGRRPDTHLLPVPRVLLVEPLGDPNFSADLSDEAQMIEMLDDKAASHVPFASRPQRGQPPTNSLDLTLPNILHKGQSKLRNAGLCVHF